MIWLSICGHHFKFIFLQVEARLAQKWQAINKLPASEGVSFIFHLILIFPYDQNCSSSKKL